MRVTNTRLATQNVSVLELPAVAVKVIFLLIFIIVKFAYEQRIDGQVPRIKDTLFLCRLHIIKPSIYD